MSIFFSNKALLGLLLFAAVPLLIHLLARARPPVFPFSTIRFIRKAVRLTQRVRRPHDWLLLALRTAAALALALMFLRPVIFGLTGFRDHTQPRTTVLIVDASASMAARTGAQSRFAEACAHADAYLGRLSARDFANLILLQSPPQRVFPEPGVNHAYLREALRRGETTRQAGDPEAAIRMAIDQLAGAEGRREICIVSDFQATNWRDAIIDIPDDISVLPLAVGAVAPDNQAITRLFTVPAAPLAGERLECFALVHNYSDTACTREITLRAGEQVESFTLHLPAWGEAAAMLTTVPGDSGEFIFEAQLEDDLFPLDNTRWNIVTVRDRLRTGMVAEQASTAQAWRRALDATDWFHIETVGLSSDMQIEADVLLLAGWDGSAYDAVMRYWHNGGLVLWHPGPATPVQLAHSLLAAEPDSSTTPIRRETTTAAFLLELNQPDHPVFEIFAHGAYGNPARATVNRRYNLPAALHPDTRTLISYNDGVPALTLRREGGTWITWNIGMQPPDGNAAALSEFVPLLSELLLQNRSDGDGGRQTAAPGQPLRRMIDAMTADSRLLLRHHSGEELSVTTAPLPEGVEAISEPARYSGLYTWLADDRPIGFSVVNFPPVESDLRALEELTIGSRRLELGNPDSAMARHEGIPVWHWFLIALAGLLIAETAVARRTKA